jgi:hypothetical protein
MGLMLFLGDNRSTTLIVIGSLGFVVGLVFMKLDSIFLFFADKSLLSFISVLFSQSYGVFIRFVIFGLILIGIGIVFKVFKLGFKLGDFASWFKQRFSKEKLKKSKKGEVVLDE